MPKNSVQLRTFFFTHPKTSASIVWSVSTLSLFIGLCVDVIPRGLGRRDEGQALEDAKALHTSTENQLTQARLRVQEAKQRVIDLGCAMDGFEAFNTRVIDLQQQIANSNLTGTDLLQLYGGLQFVMDKAVTTSSTAQKSYTTYTTTYINKNFYRTAHHHPYKEVTTIEQLFQSLVAGMGINIMPLNCGYYSRLFQIKPPEMYMTWEGPQSRSGSMTSGTISIRFQRGFGSRIPMTYTLDEKTVQQAELVPRNNDNQATATDLSSKLFTFLATAVAAFNATGFNYPALQSSINSTIPALTDMANAINTRLMHESENLAEEQMMFDAADDVFNTHLAIWLPIILVLPASLALLTYCFLVKCNTLSSMNAGDDVDMHSVASEGSEDESSFTRFNKS